MYNAAELRPTFMHTTRATNAHLRWAVLLKSAQHGMHATAAKNTESGYCS